MSKRIGNLPANINIMNPVPNKDAKSISKLIRNNGKISGYQLSDGTVLSKSEGVALAKQGGIRGVAIASRNGSEYLRPAGRLGIEQPRRSAEHKPAKLRMNAPDEAKGSAARQTLFCLCFLQPKPSSARFSALTADMYGARKPFSASCRPGRSSCRAAPQS